LLTFSNNGKNVATKGSTGTRYKDAACYIKKIEKSDAPVIKLINPFQNPKAGAADAGDALKNSKDSYSETANSGDRTGKEDYWQSNFEGGYHRVDRVSIMSAKTNPLWLKGAKVFVGNWYCGDLN